MLLVGLEQSWTWTYELRELEGVRDVEWAFVEASNTGVVSPKQPFYGSEWLA